MICITGANGWLGLNLIEYLSKRPGFIPDGREATLRGLIHPQGTAEILNSVAPGIQIARGDIRNVRDNESFLEGAKGAVLIHTAGVIHPARVADFYSINLDGTRLLLEAAVKAGVKRAVIVSSNSPCGCNPHPGHLFDEESPYRPYMNYGCSKMEMELMARDFHTKGALEVVIIRAPWFYGPHQPPRQGLFFEMIRDGKVPLVGSGNNVRSMAYTENLAQGIVLASMLPHAAGQTYWIADERPYSMNEIIGTIEHLLESEFGQQCAHRRMQLPGIISEIALLMDWGLQGTGLYNQKIHVLSEMNKSIACSVDKAKRELGYNPQIALEEGMRRSLAELFSTVSLKK
jgi:nucleoside-diphosphate-sugar epimerase